ncbi:alpha/beta hydrolase [bacterium]|nr:alpha/beta hydrolase [bacterium]
MKTLLLSLCVVLLAGGLAGQELQILERREVGEGLVREKLLLGGWDSSDPVPAIAVYPKGRTALPLVVLLHWFQGRKEDMEPWARELAPKEFFVLAIDLHLHGERGVRGIFARPDLPSLGEEYSVFVHQVSIAHSAHDFPFILKSLDGRKEIDLSRIGVGGISMGGSLAIVLAWQEKRISAVASLVGACDFWWDVTKFSPGPQQEKKKRSYSPRVKRLVSSIDPWPRLNHMPPKALFVASGRKDHFIDIESMRRFATNMQKHYASFPERFRFREEDVGHEATGSMRHEAEEWFVLFLGKTVLLEKPRFPVEKPRSPKAPEGR